MNTMVLTGSRVKRSTMLPLPQIVVACRADLSRHSQATAEVRRRRACRAEVGRRRVVVLVLGTRFLPALERLRMVLTAFPTGSYAS